MTDLERFVAESNVTRYRKILEQESSPEKRKIIFSLLEKEENLLKSMNILGPSIGDFCGKS